MAHTQAQTGIAPSVMELLARERAQALSAREWRFRLAGYGYAIKEVGKARVLTKLPQGIELGLLPGDFLS